ncbi:MAG: cobyrinate a,c-diamide synthase [Syntrophomonadaceae bacterium]
MQYPRLIIAGVQSGVGKTTLTLGTIAALHRRGQKVQPFKVGPDYIDSGLHFWAAERPSYNLDTWMCPPDMVRQVFAANASQADVSIIEGVMGLFDGARVGDIQGSSADIALLLDAPVILVVNVEAMAGSAIALVKGYRDYHPRVKLGGVILNRASAYHRTYIQPVMEQELGIPVLGCFKPNKEIHMPERHLGLLPADENRELTNLIQKMADMVEKHLDLDRLLKIAQTAPEIDIAAAKNMEKSQVHLGVARDKAFSFYYQDSLDFLEEKGVQLVFFSPMEDEALPALDGLYFGGGFPEMFIEHLSRNESMISSVIRAYQNGMPIYAECGGYMYLCRELEDWSGRVWNGAGLVPARVKMTRNLQALGYIEARALTDSPMAAAGQILRGHEFHYSRIEEMDKGPNAFAFYGGLNADHRQEGYAKGNLIASYLHIQMRSHPEAVERFIQSCQSYRLMKEQDTHQTGEARAVQGE